MDYFDYVAAKEGGPRKDAPKRTERRQKPALAPEPTEIGVQEFDGSTTIVNRIRAAILERMRP